MPGLEVGHQKFLKRVHEETDNPEWNIENHPARKILARYPQNFGNWVAYLENLLLLKKAGYPFAKNDLDLTEWKAVAVLESLQTTRRHRDGGPN
ncbi:MAG: hypothetical protein H8E42_09310 [Nitrospinae bacterium]|nr:hypothetical protein [Nitrospinota bacterium]MBL7020692.1 hypothetical protein [Nitrospinaceae bacterium]